MESETKTSAQPFKALHAILPKPSASTSASTTNTASKSTATMSSSANGSSKPSKRLRDDGLPTTLEEQVALLAQVVQFQAAKIRKLECALARVESFLPDFGALGDAAVVRDRVRVDEDDADLLSDGYESEWRRRRDVARAGLGGALGGGNVAVAKEGKEKDDSKRTLYQAFMSAEIPRIKNEHPEMAQKEAFKIAANNWAKHPDNPRNAKTPAAAAAAHK
jgi:hypothetical protein